MLFKKYHDVPYEYDQLTINHYLPGQGIFHKDYPLTYFIFSNKYSSNVLNFKVFLHILIHIVRLKIVYCHYHWAQLA